MGLVEEIQYTKNIRVNRPESGMLLTLYIPTWILGWKQDSNHEILAFELYILIVNDNVLNPVTVLFILQDLALFYTIFYPCTI